MLALVWWASLGNQASDSNHILQQFPDWGYYLNESWWAFFFSQSSIHGSCTQPFSPKWLPFPPLFPISKFLWAVQQLEISHVCLSTLCINEGWKGSTQELTGTFMQDDLKGVIGKGKCLRKALICGYLQPGERGKMIMSGSGTPF